MLIFNGLIRVDVAGNLTQISHLTASRLIFPANLVITKIFSIAFRFIRKVLKAVRIGVYV
jgi:hypothetical protein